MTEEWSRKSARKRNSTARATREQVGPGKSRMGRVTNQVPARRADPLVFVFPSDHRLASYAAVAPQEIAKEAFLLASKAAPAVRRVVLEYFNRAGIDLKPEHEVHNVVHAISMITSTRAVMLLPAYTKRYLPESIATRPVKGEVPTLDLVLAYHKANKSPILKLLLSRVGKLAEAS